MFQTCDIRLGVINEKILDDFTSFITVQEMTPEGIHQKMKQDVIE